MATSKSRTARWVVPVGLVIFAFLLKACTERDPTESTVSSKPQLGQAAGNQCTFVDPDGVPQVFDAPCVEVTVTVSGQGKDEPAADAVVELYNGGFGEGFTGEGLIGINLTDDEGKVAFNLSEFVSEESPLGLCAVFKGLRDVQFALGGAPSLDAPPGVIPNEESDGVEDVSVDFEGRVTDTRKKDGVPLTLDNFVDNCINWDNPADAPFSVAFDEVERLSLKTKASFNLETECRFSDGGLDFGTSDADCNSWMVLDLTKGIGLDDEPLCTLNETTLQWDCSKFWVGIVPYAGIKPGLIVSGSGFGNAAINRGLVLDANYQGELAFFGEAGEFFTASLKDVSQAGGDGKPGGGKPPKDGATDLEASVDLLPTTCVTNALDESDGDGGTGWDFRDPIKFGYFGDEPYLNLAGNPIFPPDLTHITIWFDMAPPSGGFDPCTGTEPTVCDSEAEVQLHMRSKPDDGTSSGPTTDNIVVSHNFQPCLAGQPPIEISTDPAIQSVACRQVEREDADFIEVTYVIDTDPARLYEFRLEAFVDVTPDPARSDDTRAMTLIDKPNSCPLRDGTTGVSTDPKWVAPSGRS